MHGAAASHVIARESTGRPRVACVASASSDRDGRGGILGGVPWELRSLLKTVEKDLRSCTSRPLPELLTSPIIRLKVLACEVGGRWGGDTVELFKDLASHKAMEAPPELRARARLRWENRWWAMLSVAAQDAVAASLLKDGIIRTGLSYAGQPEFDDILADTQGGTGSVEFSRIR